mmetsp:Transcript_11042/g.16772  ORF Transcript_11042/g.16772 Transcript_11042/m.16772 type:complete len:117 (-) Transcript_11042:38-388(-)
MFSIAQAASLAKEDLEVTMIFSNKTKDDILIKDYIDEIEKANPHFKCHHTLTRHDAEKHGEWTGLTGRVNYEMLQKAGFPGPGSETLIAICGPSQMKTDVTAFLKENGYDAEDQIA